MRHSSIRSFHAFLAYALALVLAAACGVRVDPGDGDARRPAEAAPRASGVSPLEAGLRAAYVLARQRDAGPAFDVMRDGEALRAANPSQAFDLRFTRDGIDLLGEAWTAAIALEGFGCVGDVSTLDAADPTLDPAQPNRVTQDHGPLVAWYLNGPLGLEQGFEVTSRPPCADAAPLRIRIAAHGLHAAMGTRGEVVLRDNDGARALQVDGLYVTDAAGHVLDATLTSAGDAVVVDVDATTAAFPLAIDPLWSHEAKLGVPGDGTSDLLGSSVGTDGTTAVIGAIQNHDEGFRAGAAFVFVQTGGTWALQQKLTASDGDAYDNFGVSVGVSGDTVIVGAPSAGNVGAAYVYVRNGTTWTEEQKLISPGGGAASDLFGSAVDVWGDTAVVGAYQNDSFGLSSGAAYVYERTGSTWSSGQQIMPSGSSGGDRFGNAVSIDGDTIVVGAYQEFISANDSGSAYVFVRNGALWTEEQRLEPSDGTANDWFGDSVSVSGDTILVGARRDDDVGSFGGSAYVFARNAGAWTEQQKLLPLDVEAGDAFGASVSVDGDTAIVGAMGDDDLAPSAGAAYVFTRTGSVWSLQQKLVASDGAENDSFGTAVGLFGDTAIVGADENDGQALNAGAAYASTRTGSTWGGEQKLVDPEASMGEDVVQAFLGQSVRVEGDTALVGAPQANVAGEATGAAYVFVRSGATWTLEQKLFANDSVGGDRFASAVALSGDTAVIGAYRDDDAGNEAGSAYVFVRSGTTWSEQQKLTAADAADLDHFGVAAALSGDTMAVGANLDDDAGASSGSVYVFVRNAGTWTAEQKIVAADGVPSGRLGGALALEADTLVAGASGDANDQGAAYVYVRNAGTWTLEQKLIASDGASGDWFGTGVALAGDTVVAGAPEDDDAGASSGSAYVFVRSAGAWAEQQKLVASDAMTNDDFGTAVAVEGDTTLVGAHHDFAGSETGRAYVFVRSAGAWTEQQQLTPADPAGADRFGASVALAGDTAVVGAPRHNDEGNNSGTAYVLRVDNTGDPCLQNADCDRGFCVDGVCCLTACGGGATGDCQACTNAMTGLADGVCAPVLVGTVCRAAAGVCDVGEQCDGVATACPTDALLPGTTVCRAAVDVCDVADLCTGTGASCPPDAVAVATTECRASTGSCDPAEQCDGVGVACPVDALASAGAPGTPSCAPLLCDGVGAVCPSTCVSPSDCAAGFTCVGGACVPGLPVGDPCTSDADCGTGFCVDGVCCDAACGAGDPGDCQACVAAETGGDDGTCAATTAGIVCRAMAGACDAPEQCDGTATTCPADAPAPDGTSCDDADACTDSDACVAGACAPGPDICGSGGAGASNAGGSNGVGGAAPGGGGAGGGGLGPVSVTEGGCSVAHRPARRHDVAFGFALLGLLVAWRRREPHLRAR